MATQTTDPTVAAGTGQSACAFETARRVAHVAHEADLIKSMIADTAETAAYETRRAITRGRRNIERARDAVEYRVRRAPLVAVGAAFAAGIGAALVLGQCVRALRQGDTLKRW